MTKHWNTLKTVLVLFLLFSLTLTSCGKKDTSLVLADQPILHETEFGGAYIALPIDDFNKLGFAFGDSVDVTFSNGYTMEDLPYYNGYYTVFGEALLIGYPGYPYIKAAINNGEDLWVLAQLDDEDTATITLREQGKYLDVQSARDIYYVDDRSKFPSDEAFANFRPMEAGNMMSNWFYRSASPCDNQHQRAPYVSTLMEKAGINAILNLADTDEKIQGYIAKEDFQSPYFLSLYEAGNVVPLALTANYGSQDFREKVAKGLTQLIHMPGPYLIHCTEGKDRTGFVCLLLQALADASYDEIVADYMITYDNYYQITENQQGEKYNIIIEMVLNPMIQIMTGEDVDITTASLAPYAETYLQSGGMTSADIALLKSILVGAK